MTTPDQGKYEAPLKIGKRTIRISLVGLALDWDMFDTKTATSQWGICAGFCFVCTGEMKFHELCLPCGTRGHTTCHLSFTHAMQREQC